MGSTREGTVEHRPSQLKCQHCLFVLRKELKFILAAHTDGRVWTRGGRQRTTRWGAGGAVRPSRPIAKSATGCTVYLAMDMKLYGNCKTTISVILYPRQCRHIGFSKIKCSLLIIRLGD